MAYPLTHNTPSSPPVAALPLLETGDHLSQAEFHARYERMSEDVKAELISGVVYMQSSLKRAHGRSHSLLMTWLGVYEAETPGVQAYDNATTIMHEDSEPQPDGCLLITPECGGQTIFTADDYLQGAPELICEIASSSESIDLHAKKHDYERAGVKEYIVVALRQQRVVWFAQRQGHFEECLVEPDGIYRSHIFAGLWLDPLALLSLDGKRLLSTLRLGLSTHEHGQFAQQLASQLNSGNQSNSGSQP